MLTTQQSTSSFLMVRPLTFGFDQETAQSNTFQHDTTLPTDEIRKKANLEFETAVQLLRDHAIDVTVFNDPQKTEKPDAVFPNNWLSTWPDGHIYLYPMATKSRRVERSDAAIDLLKEQFDVRRITDLSDHETKNKYLESTGVMIFDHLAKIVYGCKSVRCDEELFLSHAAQLGYEPVFFSASDTTGYPIYHTNVLMGAQTTTAVVCLDAITNPMEKETVHATLRRTGHDVVAITHEQMNAFCGNVLEIKNQGGQLFLAMSQTAYDAFTPLQRDRLSLDKTLLPLSIPTIETIGGGSVRCMLTEIFLPHQ